jgi:hypothetical protein
MLTLLAAMLIEIGSQKQAVERGPLIEDRGPLVRLRPDGVVERYDHNEFRYRPTGSRFVPVPPKRKSKTKIENRIPRSRPGDRFQKPIPQFRKSPNEKQSFPDRWDT